MVAHGATYKYAMRTATGFSSEMDGPIRSPEHAGVVTAALAGYLSDDVNLLKAASDLLAVARECLAAEQERRNRLTPGAPATTYTEKRIAAIEAAIAKAEGRDVAS